LSSIKTFETVDLFKLLKAIMTEAEKKSKQANTMRKTPTKKSGSMPKGAVPPQLKKPRAWVEYTLKNALENGWESFTILQKKKDKETNITTQEQIEMPGSILHNGSHIYENSITDKFPAGKWVIHKEAMSLSKQRKESSHITYSEFDALYIDNTNDDNKSAISSTSSKKIIMKKTYAEKEAEDEAKKLAKEIEKETTKAEKQLKKASVAAAKESKTTDKNEKSVTKKPVIKISEPEVTVKEVVKTVAPKKNIGSNKIPDDGMVHPWTYKTKKYLRNADGETWTVGVDGAVGTWVGLFKDDKIDTSAPEPVFDDED